MTNELPRVIVLTSNQYLWAMQPFAFLFNHFWHEEQPVLVGGFSPPPFPLPVNYTFFPIAPRNFPQEQWSNGVIKLLQNIPDQYFVLLLEDYWLCRQVDLRAVAVVYEYMREHPEIVRMDLTADRLYAGGMFDVEGRFCYDIIETPSETPYQMSLQGAIWSKKLLLDLLKPGLSPWEVEINTQIPSPMRVCGTRQYPLRYANAMLKGKLDTKQLDLIPIEYLKIIHDQGMIPDDVIAKITA